MLQFVVLQCCGILCWQRLCLLWVAMTQIIGSMCRGWLDSGTFGALNSVACRGLEEFGLQELSKVCLQVRHGSRTSTCAAWLLQEGCAFRQKTRCDNVSRCHCCTCLFVRAVCQRGMWLVCTEVYIKYCMICAHLVNVCNQYAALLCR